MIKKPHIIILLVLVAIIALVSVIVFTGGRNETSDLNAENQQGGEVSDVKKVGEEWKADVAKRLYSEFCSFYGNMYNDDFILGDSYGDYYGYEQAKTNGRTGYSRFMAADRLSGILDVYGEYLTKDELNYVKSKKNEIYEAYVGVLVNFKYSKSGLHIITVRGSTCNADEHGKFLANQIRAVADENDFLEDVYLNTNFSMLDVFAEDLSPNERDIWVEPSVDVRDGKSVSTEHAIAENTDEDCQLILNKYNRTCATGEKVRFESGSWNLFCFKTKNFDQITIKTADEELKL